MHFHLPKPLHGWREFAGEVGIIVVGVLIALGAEQAVESWHWRGEARDLRASLDKEIDFNLASFDRRLAEKDCVEHRLDELDRWRAQQEAGRTVPLLHEIGHPEPLYFDTSVWQSRGEITAHIPTRARLIYADFYDTIDAAAKNGDLDAEAWRGLDGFSHAAKLSPDGLVRLDELIQRARAAEFSMESNRAWMKAEEPELGVHADFGSFAATVNAPSYNGADRRRSLCSPVLPPASANAG